jgi:hypothetical protein
MRFPINTHQSRRREKEEKNKKARESYEKTMTIDKDLLDSI